MTLDPSIKNVLIIGSGPVVIGQAAEFDYAGSQSNQPHVPLGQKNLCFPKCQHISKSFGFGDYFSA